MAQNVPMELEGDPAFVKVDTRRPAHELEPGVAADALNKRFEDGRAWPRYQVNQQPWGRAVTNLLAGASYAHFGSRGGAGATVYFYEATGLVVGRTYLLVHGNETEVTDAAMLNSDGTRAPAGNVISPGLFVAKTTQLWLWVTGTVPSHNVTTALFAVQNPKGFARFNDPDGVDTTVLVTDDWRDGGGEDGGRGRAWRIMSGNGPWEIPLNGQDVWDAARLIPCFNALVMLRHGNERHYFSAAAVNTTTSRIQLNCVPAWNNGDAVYYSPEEHSYIDAPSGGSPPQPFTDYFVKAVTGGNGLVELYTDPGLTTKLNWTGGSAQGRFYLERRATEPGFYGNGAPPLIMQPGPLTQTAFEAGFVSVPGTVAVSGFTSTVMSANNHRLIPGDKIDYVHTTGAVENFYVAVLSRQNLRLYANTGQGLSDALADNSANAVLPSPSFTTGDFIRKNGASGMPMPPGREGIYLPTGRLVIVNGANNLAISDPLDPLHFTPFQATVTANLGESDQVESLMPMGDDVVGKDVLVIGKTNSILRLVGLSGPSTGWQLKEVTREYGFLAPLATIRVGLDVWGFSRKGVVSVVNTFAGSLNNQAQPLALPMSFDLKKYIDLVDWRYADQAAAATWNNRAFIAVPLLGQVLVNGQRPVNNGVLVYNFLNQGWEGLWQGDALQVYAWARHVVYGEERLCFVNYYGQVAWLGEGWTDTTISGSYVAIADKLVTRIYCRGNQLPKLWLKGLVVWDTNRPKLSVSAQSPGYNESQALITDQTYDNTKYSTYNTPDYVPGTSDFNAPNRLDYSMAPGEVLAGPGDIHQNIPETLRMRVNDWGVQLVIQNKQGSARVQSVAVEFVPGRQTASRST